MSTALSKLTAVTARPLCKPAYDNAYVRSYRSWFEDNRRALIRWWWECDVTLRSQGGVIKVDPDEFEAFCLCQWERERQGVMP